ncbi:MAG TPA: CAP domain-containing protein [Candidatus Paceibacterota bacterium]|jgi:uncharacterized protein YkwD|nr:CAP domain-containing protein [Candidatus Paceibacterota bacterium]
MIRNIIYLIILVAGLGLMKYHVFEGVNFSSAFSNDVTYSRIKNQLTDFNTRLQLLSSKLFSGKHTNQSSDDTVKEEPIIEQKTTDRTVLNSDNILYFTNLERTKRGLVNLKFNAKLTRSANSKSRDMFANQYFAHTSPVDSEKSFAYFIENEQYSFIRISENLAIGEFKTAKQVVDAWMNSPDHRANILFPNYREIGASVQTSKMNGDTVIIIVQHFGIPKNVCPSVSQAMLSKLQSIQEDATIAKKNATKMEADMNTQNNMISAQDLDDLIGMYNITIQSYNSLVVTFQQLSAEYNAQVEKYDDCIKNLN